MKKTTTVNIGGIVYNIDIDAFEKLHKYLDAIGAYFDDSESRKEILMDIESRIAEILGEKVLDKTKVVTVEMVNEVIAIMGEPEDYADEESEPIREPQRKRQKSKVYRDPDQKILGGVCSGLGYYFNLDPVWIRLFFILVVFLGGSGLVLYFILWAIIPEATTTAEKLQMKGQPINVDNIGRTIDEEFNRVKDKFDEFAARSSKVDTSQTISKIGAAVEQFINFIANILSNFFTALGKLLMTIISFIGKFLGVLFIIGGVLLFIFLVSALFNSSTILSITSEGFHYYSLHELFNYISMENSHWIMFLLTCVFFIGIPLIAIIYGGYRLLMPNNSSFHNRGVGITLFTLWVIGLILMVVLSFQIGVEFKNESRVVEPTHKFKIESKVLHVDLNSTIFSDALDDSFDDKYSFIYRSKGENVQLLRVGRLLFQKGSHNHFIGIPRLNITKSNSDFIEIKIKKFAHGLTTKQADNRARSIEYNYEIKDSLVVFDPAFKINDKDYLFRDQSVKIELMVPINTVIDLSNSTERLIYNFGNISDEWLYKSYGKWQWQMGGHKWIMTEDGLTCISCEGSDEIQMDSTKIEIIQNIDSN